MRAAFAIAAASAIVLGVSAAPGLSLSIISPSSISDVEHLSVTAVVNNTGTETLKLLKDPRGVLSSARALTFNVASENGSPEFTGMFVKYPPDYVVKKNNAADFAFLAPVDAWNVFQYVDAAGKLSNIEATTQSAKIGASGNLVSARIESRSLSKRVSYVGCSQDRQPQIASLVTSANSLEPTRRPVLRLYALTSRRLELMLRAPPTIVRAGTDSKAGTIVHEQSHFTVNGGTRDYAYGQSRAKSLAISNAALAIMNADSHE
ncbi:hypothetical protein FRC06_009848 [Ceratobasidium sp. 370]|nr:hypothetical protein FRC06_009848 [Ceratobasidium sp. 370]